MFLFSKQADFSVVFHHFLRYFRIILSLWLQKKCNIPVSRRPCEMGRSVLCSLKSELQAQSP